MNHKLKKIIAFSLVLPPIFLYPFLFFFQIQKMYYPKTWNMTIENRKIFFLKIAMPELSDDYFELLKKCEKYLTKEKKYFVFEAGENELQTAISLSRAFSPFWLSPSRAILDDGKTINYDYKIYFRKKPLENEKIIETVKGEKESYLVEYSRL